MPICPRTLSTVVPVGTSKLSVPTAESVSEVKPLDTKPPEPVASEEALPFATKPPEPISLLSIVPPLTVDVPFAEIPPLINSTKANFSLVSAYSGRACTSDSTSKFQ